MTNIGQNQKCATESVMEQLASDLVRYQVDQWIHGKITGTVPMNAPLKISVNAFIEDRNATKARVQMQSISYSRGHERFSDFPKVEIDNAQLELSFAETTTAEPVKEEETEKQAEHFTKMIPQKKLDTLTNLTNLDLSMMEEDELKVAYMALATKMLLDNFEVFYAIFKDEEGRSFIFRWRDCEEPTVKQVDEDILKKTQEVLVNENEIVYCRDSHVYFSAAEISTENRVSKEGMNLSHVIPDFPSNIREVYSLMRNSKFIPSYINISWLYEK